MFIGAAFVGKSRHLMLIPNGKFLLKKIVLLIDKAML
jgi:hypothetical protein